jgi:hypothetical protein
MAPANQESHIAMKAATAPRDSGARRSKAEEDYAPILGGFIPLAALWDGRTACGPLFPSDLSARWFIRNNRAALLAAEALALYRGRMLIHPERFQAAAQRIAIDAARHSRAEREAGTGAATT